MQNRPLPVEISLGLFASSLLLSYAGALSRDFASLLALDRCLAMSAGNLLTSILEFLLAVPGLSTLTHERDQQSQHDQCNDYHCDDNY